MFLVLISSKFLVVTMFSLRSLDVRSSAGSFRCTAAIFVDALREMKRQLRLARATPKSQSEFPFRVAGITSLKQARGLARRRDVLQRKRRWRWKHAVNKTFPSSLRNRSKIAEIGGGSNQVENQSKNRRIGVSWQPCLMKLHDIGSISEITENLVKIFP